GERPRQPPDHGHERLDLRHVAAGQGAPRRARRARIGCPRPRLERRAPDRTRRHPGAGGRRVTNAPAATPTVARRLDGAPFASEIRDRVAADVATYVKEHGHPPGLAVVVCGRSAPSMVY